MRAKTVALAVVLVAVVLVAGGFGYQAYLQHQVEERLQQAVAELPPAVSVEYGEVDVGFLGREVRVDDVAFSVEGAAPTVIERIVVSDVDRRHEPPHRLRLEARGVAQDLSGMSPERSEFFRRLGYTTLRGTYELAYDYDPDARELEVRQLRGDVEDVAGLGIYLRLTDFDLERTVNQAQMMPDFKIAEFEISYRDASLMHRLLDRMAEDRDVSREELVAQLLLDIDEQAAEGGEFLQEVGRQVKTFIQDPQRLTITATPDGAVAVAEVIALGMLQPERLPELLNVRVTATTRATTPSEAAETR